jgi:hypothetical protein
MATSIYKGTGGTTTRGKAHKGADTDVDKGALFFPAARGVIVSP